MNNTTNGSPRTATYQITPPGGSWATADNGTYTVSMNADQVNNVNGNFTPAGSLGTFAVAINAADEIDVVLVPVGTPTSADTESSLPASLAQEPVGGTFYVEVWTKDVDGSTNGITGGDLNFSFATANVSGGTINHGGIYTNLTGGTVNNSSGMVTDLSGNVNPGDNSEGVSQWVRLGYVSFTATASGTAAFTAAAGSDQFARANEGGVPWADVELNQPPASINNSTPVVTEISPARGPLAGGTSVTITGTNLLKAKAVEFGSVAGKIIRDTATKIVVTSPRGVAGTVDVTVRGARGVSATSAVDQFTYVAAPIVNGIAPNSVSVASSTSVTITGSNLGSTTTATVKFGKVAATITSDNGSTIVVNSPAGKAGTVNVTVTTVGGVSATSSADKFTYVAAPTVKSIKPATGLSTGGTSVTITGTNLLNAKVYFGGVPATISEDRAASIVATSPAGTGTVYVTVTTAGGTSATSPADTFTYVAAPTTKSFSPASGLLGTPVAIAGTNLLDFAANNSGRTAATSFGAESGNESVADSPLSTSKVDVMVAPAASVVINSDAFTPVVNDLALLDLMALSSSSATIRRKMVENLMESLFV